MSSDGEYLPDTPSEGLPDVGDQTQPRVAVDVLQRDQERVLFTGDSDRNPPIKPLVDGFDTRRDLINWWQATAVRTFGYAADVFPPKDIFRDRTLQGVLIAKVNPTDGIDGEQFRYELLDYILHACDRAHDQLETRATEWLPQEDGNLNYIDIDPEQQRHVAMRPSFSRLDSQQGTCLKLLWGGFEGREQRSRWLKRLPRVADTGNEFDRGLASEIRRDPNARHYLLADGASARRYREWLATFVLLPAFARRAAKLRGSERVEKKQQERKIPHG